MNILINICMNLITDCNQLLLIIGIKIEYHYSYSNKTDEMFSISITTRKTVNITIEEYVELEHLRNYKRINELDFLVRQNYKLEYSENLLKKKINEFIKYDCAIETKCHDCNQLLLIDDIIKCEAHKVVDNNDTGGGRICNSTCCDKCLIYNIYRQTGKELKYVKELKKCCKFCYEQNDNVCNKCNLKIDIDCKVQKCYGCHKNFCYECEVLFKKLKQISSSFTSREVEIHCYHRPTQRKITPFISYFKRNICLECNEEQIKIISNIIQKEIFHKCEKDDGNDILKYLISKNN